MVRGHSSSIHKHSENDNQEKAAVEPVLMLTPALHALIEFCPQPSSIDSMGGEQRKKERKKRKENYYQYPASNFPSQTKYKHYCKPSKCKIKEPSQYTSQELSKSNKTGMQLTNLANVKSENPANI